mmetsp:Transcript_5921/g.10694  ORF Transcript_5921/g.10694 Transcript_5921/m.10694 type:complete len:98 (-) Transcript_5921:1650-1943(-)
MKGGREGVHGGLGLVAGGGGQDNNAGTTKPEEDLHTSNSFVVGRSPITQPLKGERLAESRQSVQNIKHRSAQRGAASHETTHKHFESSHYNIKTSNS